MSEAFQLAHAFTARWEGGLSDHPSDPGGITNHGVSLRWVQDLARQARDECRRLLRSCDGCRERATPQCGWQPDLDTTATWMPTRHPGPHEAPSRRAVQNPFLGQTGPQGPAGAGRGPFTTAR